MPFDLQTELNERAQQGLLRQRQILQSGQGRYITLNDRRYLNFSSNDYLGLAAQPFLIKAWQEGLDRWGVGSGASPLVTGYTEAHAMLEQTLAEWLQVESVLLFSTGFGANQAVIKALLQKEHIQYQDRLNHASLQEAGAQSPAKMLRFRHNDMAHLASLLQPRSGLIMSEGVFSMDGDQAPCQQLAELAAQSGNWLMLDDAHGIGVLGEQGRGTLAQQGVAPDSVHIRMATFGKALGVAGAFVGGSRQFTDYLVNFARDYVYSTHMPPAQAHAISAAVAWVKHADDERAHLQALIRQFKAGIAELGLVAGESSTAIQPLIIGDADKAVAVANKLRERGLWVTAIRPPTVPKGTARLRITLTAAHQPSDVCLLLNELKECVTDA
ncbi:8-amino-7-oxononanoate synthase [uncultured Tolumonas sp.]|uniref:8-amino-7-oxononanoate synthase n=1 Tax=uncultured Tolumonas sp. TaxID=263765 RepID=UPI002931729C|nr:8-amino-7-oxononanoate synthase [uncultured Tolumonas sp.]